MSIQFPTNEQETIYHFIRVIDDLGFEITNFWSSFPDATIVDLKPESNYKKTYKVEFEYKLSSFIKHKHDPRLCDLVVCWLNDIQSVPFPLTVWTLSTEEYLEIQTPNPTVMESFLKVMQDKEKAKAESYKKRYSKKPTSNMFKGLLEK